MQLSTTDSNVYELVNDYQKLCKKVYRAFYDIRNYTNVKVDVSEEYVANEHVKLQANDVIIGCGFVKHKGNVTFRNIVAKYSKQYKTTPVSEKKLIVKTIYNAMTSQDPPGRILIQVSKDNKDLFYIVNEKHVKDKKISTILSNYKSAKADLTYLKPYLDNNNIQINDAICGSLSTSLINHMGNATYKELIAK